MKLMLDYNDSTATVSFLFYDATKGVSSGAITRGNMSVCFDGGHTAEWVDERPTLIATGKPDNLAPFEDISWPACYARTNTGADYYGAGFFTTYGVDMIRGDGSNTSNTILASPSLIDRYSFIEKWYLPS